MLEASEILFVGLGKSAVLWYRCALPATHLGADWVGVIGRPPAVQVVTGRVRGDTRLPRYDDYKVIVIQQPYGRAWMKQINALRARGITVLYEVDDYLHGVGDQPSHDHAKHYSREQVKAFEMCMRVCDGMICSTDYLARRYAKFNRTIYVCRNGLDVRRFQLTRPPRDTVNIGWAGATGHLKSLQEWLQAVVRVMWAHPNTCFVSIGQPGVAAAVAQGLGDPRRGIGLPFAALETYPAAMTMIDIAIAPAGTTTWYRAKSDLRWLEASALGIPIIADPGVYRDIEPGTTGYHALTDKEVAEQLEQLVENPELCREIGENARAYLYRERTSEIAATQWSEVCNAAVGGYQSMHQLERSTT